MHFLFLNSQAQPLSFITICIWSANNEHMNKVFKHDHHYIFINNVLMYYMYYNYMYYTLSSIFKIN